MEQTNEAVAGQEGDETGLWDAFREAAGARGVRPERLPFFVRWAGMFLRRVGGVSAEEAVGRVKEFLEELGERGVPEWQVRQAGEAAGILVEVH